MNPYLKTKILTAKPEQLRLMLFEGAVKFCRQARDALAAREWETMYNAVVRAQKIVMELQNSLSPEQAPDLCDKLSALYVYIYKRLVDASMQRDLAALDECIQLLDYERQTWEMVMRKLADRNEAATAATDPDSPATLARIGPDSQDPAEPGPSLSVQG